MHKGKAPIPYLVTQNLGLFWHNFSSRTSTSKGNSDAPANRVEDGDENAVYLEDLDPSFPVRKPRSKAKPQSSTKPRFYDHDPYHLPDMDFDSKITEASQSVLDPRLVTPEEMQSFISEMAPSDFDLTSEAFRSLSTEVQYEIIGDLRLKSRQTSFKRLQNMLKNSETPMDFSKEQIKGLKERNRLTQKLLTTTDSMGKANVEIPIRIAGERNREYVLVKNEGEGKGWILGMRDVGTRDQPIIVDDPTRDGVKPKEVRDKRREDVESGSEIAEEVPTLVLIVPRMVQKFIYFPSRSPRLLPPTTTVTQGQDPRSHQSRTAFAAVGKRQKLLSPSSPVKSGSGIFPRRPSGSKSGVKTTKVPLFVPDEEDDVIPQVDHESEGDEWEDVDEGLEEAQMSIAIAESLESQHRSSRTSDTRALAQAPTRKAPIERSTEIDIDEGHGAVTDIEDQFTSPSRLATQLSIAGARKPLSTRAPSDSVRGTAALTTGTPFVSPKKLIQGPTTNQVLDSPPDGLTREDTGDKGECDEDDDMEEVTIPRAIESDLLISPDALADPDPATAADLAGTSLAVEVEDVVAKRFAELQKIFAEKRNAFRAENLEAPEEMGRTPEMSRSYSPGLEYADDEVGVIEVEENGKEPIEVRPSPPQSDEDEDMEEVEVAIVPPLVPPCVPQHSVNSELPEPFVAAVIEGPLPRRNEGNADGENEDVPISDWSRSPSPCTPVGETGPPTSVLTLDRSRGLLDPGEPFERVPPGEQDQEHDDFDAAHEMDPDAEAGEFARWMSQVKGRSLDDVRKEIEQEITGLRKQQKAAMRDSEDITNQMITQIMVSSSTYHNASTHHSEIRSRIRR